MKLIKEKNAELSALDILIKINESKKIKKKYILEIQKFIDEINEYIENNAKENTCEEVFLDLENFNKIQKPKNKHFDV